MKKLSLEAAEILASKFRVKIGVSSIDPISVKSVLRKTNILTIYRPLSETSYGLSLKSKNGDRFMLVNSNSTRGRQHFTIAHELFHLYYDEQLTPHICGSNVDGVNNTEKNADLFASALLMPKEGILQFISLDEITSKNVTLATVIKLEQFFSVSRSSLLYRLKALGLLTEGNLQSLLHISVRESAKQYGYDLSLYHSGNENLVIGDFGAKARLLYDSEKISEGHYLELLNLISNGEN
jgi:Zn-dependent peptidase ImmA (M78 family)